MNVLDSIFAVFLARVCEICFACTLLFDFIPTTSIKALLFFFERTARRNNFEDHIFIRSDK